MAEPYFRLRIKSLKFISAVDAGAQGPIANVALIKRAPAGAAGDDIDATCHVYKLDEKLGLVFGWALATSLDGGATPHVDLQKDAIVGDDELIKIAAEFMEASAANDVLHDENPDGKIVFAMPLTKAVCAALGIQSDTHGLAIAMKPSPETFKRFLSKELNAFSIGGVGEREVVKAKPDAANDDGADAEPDADPDDATKAKCAGCGQYGKADDETCKGCGKAMKRAPAVHIRNRYEQSVPIGALGAPTRTAKGVLSAADKDTLPDSAFLYIESGGKKDADGKTTPRSLRHFPYRDSSGKIDIPHLRDAIGRIPQSSLPADVRDRLQVRAEKLLGQQHAANKRAAVGQKPAAPTPKPSAMNGADCETGPDDPDADDTDGSKPPASAAKGISTPSAATPSVGVTKENEMADATNEIRELRDENSRLAKMATLTDRQRRHFESLAKSDQVEFLNLTPSLRDGRLDDIEKSNVVVYESPYTGEKFRKNDDTRLVQLAMQSDAATKLARDNDIAKRDMEFDKSGSENMAHFAKGAKKNLRARIMKALNAEFSDRAEYEEAVAALKQADVALAELSKSRGVDASAEENTPSVALRAAVMKYQQDHRLPNYEAALVKATAEDSHIQKLWTEATRAA
ncbi:MAG TPA: hypothetical protein VFQ42_22375 [Mycobacterium sp.]|nr:hypothetical protein [Mycobacterium sp.]